MWVRSQNKENIHQIQGFSFCTKQNIATYKVESATIMGMNLSGVEYSLGNYKSTERVLEVLDDIELTIRESNQNTVYQMPKE